MSRKKGDSRLARLRGLIRRAEQHGGERAVGLGKAHEWLLEIARRLEPGVVAEGERALTGAEVRARVEGHLQEIAAAVAKGSIAEWLQQPVEHLRTVLLRLGDGLYHCYDVPGLPRTNNDLEQFYRRVKASERRITGRKRSDSFVVRVGGFAVYAITASEVSEAELQPQLASVTADDWQRERKVLRGNQERQTKMRRFRLHRDAYLADLEARWAQLANSP